MKKVLATVLATSMALTLSAAAFAADIGNGRLTVEGMSGITADSQTNKSSHYIALTPDTKGGEVDIQTFGQLYTWGDPDEREISLIPGRIRDNEVVDYNCKITSLNAHVNTNNVSVSVKRNDGTLYNNGKIPVIKLKGATKWHDFTNEDDYNDMEVDLDITIAWIDDKGKLEGKKDITLTLKADDSAAYSKTQSVEDGANYSVSKSGGSIFYFDEMITEKTRIRVNEYVDVFFKGNYGTDKENMRVLTDKIDEVEKYFDDTDIDYYDFFGTPKFASPVKVAIDADANAVIYEYNKKTGDIKKIETDYESNAKTFETKNLGCFIVAEEEYEDGNIKKDDTQTVKEEPSQNTDKDNPGTGAANQ